MTRTNIQIYLCISLIIALAIGVYVLIWWYIKVSTKLNKSIEKDRTIDSIAMKSLFYNFPSLIIFILLFIPSIYFGHKLKQLVFCQNVIKFNSKNNFGFDINNPDFKEDCGCFDIKELTSKQ